MDCTVDCHQDIKYYKAQGLRIRFKKWFKNLVIEGAEHMSKIK